MKGQHFDLVVCAGVSSLKWVANQNPETDWAQIQELLDVLSTIRADRFVLISTIDVYPAALMGADESEDLAGLENQAYGYNRQLLEQRVAKSFSEHCILRLPAIFGVGLRKNAIYDLLHNRRIDAINPAAALQWYPLHRLWNDCETACNVGLRRLNLVTQPLSMDAIISRSFPDAAVGPESHPAPFYNFRTRYAEYFGGDSGYLLNSNQILEEIAAFVAAERGI